MVRFFDAVYWISFLLSLAMQAEQKRDPLRTYLLRSDQAEDQAVRTGSNTDPWVLKHVALLLT